jgi:glycosyltransferase involved in cell wall biosynthesis
MSKVSVIIPARNEPFLSNTVDDLFKNATGDIEVIVVLDAYWPSPNLNTHENLIMVHRGSVCGMRENINTGAQIASGDYLMKLDAHCMVGPGFDEILAADCEKNWLAVPSRFSLDAEKWERTQGPVDYLYLTFPYTVDDLYGFGFHGRKWKGAHGLTGNYWQLEHAREDILIDDILSFQGSCWFMHKEHFNAIDGLDAANYNFHQESAELGFKTWLSGGRCVRNKKTWYAHLHKGKKHGRGFRLSKRQMIESEVFSTDFWMNNRWPKQTRKLKWLIEKFWPLEGWPDDWQDAKWPQEYEHPGLIKYPQLRKK